MYGEKPSVNSKTGAWFAMLGGSGFFAVSMAYILMAFSEGDFRMALIAIPLFGIGLWFFIPGFQYLHREKK